jgi:hypothetical protein
VHYNSLAFVRKTVIELYGNEVEDAQSLGELAPHREEHRVLADLTSSGRIKSTDSPDTVREALAQTNLSDSVASNLALSVTLGAGVGIYYPVAYEKLTADLAGVLADAEGILRTWIDGHHLTLINLFKSVDLRVNPLMREFIKLEAINERNYDTLAGLLECIR